MSGPIYGKTLCVEWVDGVMLIIHGKEDPTAKEWSAYCDYAGATRRAAGGTMRTLVMTSSDVGPNAGQRAEYKKKVAGANNRVAVLSGGNVTRAIITVMSWFNPDMKAFGAADHAQALEYLGVRSAPNLRATIQRLEAHLEGEQQSNTG